jgi:ADP-dependent NAD(P)H-hydrate dehydratase / NAD(P)H-hydrate epimerase
MIVKLMKGGRVLKVASVADMRRIEAAANAAGLTYSMMMKNAGRAVAGRVLEILAEKTDTRVTILVGPGNNGGDGLVAGRIVALESNILVRFYLLKPRSDDDVNFKAVHDAGLLIMFADHDRDKRVLRNMITSADVVVDALYGIGVRLPLDTPVAKILRSVKQAFNEIEEQVDLEHPEGTIITPATSQIPKIHSQPYVIAVDCPSGLNCDAGIADSDTLPANETITFIAAKPGLFEFPGASYTGLLSIATIGVSDSLPELSGIKYSVADSRSVSELLPARPTNANKGIFGKVMVVGGSSNYVGAAGLSAMAAYRSGGGLVTVSAVQSVVAALSTSVLEPTWITLPDEEGFLSPKGFPLLQAGLHGYDAVLVGPGMGIKSPTQELVAQLLSRRAELPPLVLDADALNILSMIDVWWTLLPAQTIITPHPGEMARLTKMTIEEIQSQRWQIAAAKAAEWQVILVLKGANTLVADPDGYVTVLPFATDALATAGTGDVLAGLITGFLGQGVSPFNAALLGAYVHGLAGMQAISNVGNSSSVVASDVLNAIPQALTKLKTAQP